MPTRRAGSRSCGHERRSGTPGQARGDGWGSTRGPASTCLPRTNKLFYGDNLDVLRRKFDPASVDLFATPAKPARLTDLPMARTDAVKAARALGDEAAQATLGL